MSAKKMKKDYRLYLSSAIVSAVPCPLSDGSSEPTEVRHGHQQGIPNTGSPRELTRA